jgi:hypothetical protein
LRRGVVEIAQAPAGIVRREHRSGQCAGDREQDDRNDKRRSERADTAREKIEGREYFKYSDADGRDRQCAQQRVAGGKDGLVLLREQRNFAASRRVIPCAAPFSRGRAH